MTRYCKVENGVITKYNLTRKQFGVGEASDESICIAKGYLPIEDNVPNVDTSTQRIAGNSYSIDGNKVVKVYQVVDIPQEELIAKKVKEAETAIQSHINSKVKELGYDNENSIAKYLVDGNPFYDECVAISLWIGDVWVYTHQVQNDVIQGNREFPTIEELLAELPTLGD